MKKTNKPETKRDFLQEEEDKDYCAFLLFIEDLYCFAVALEKKRRERKELILSFLPPNQCLLHTYYFLYTSIFIQNLSNKIPLDRLL